MSARIKQMRIFCSRADLQNRTIRAAQRPVRSDGVAVTEFDGEQNALTNSAPAAQRRNINSPARKCRVREQMTESASADDTSLTESQKPWSA